ncbi:hypothetical protein BaRGS_00002067 [Batillaria attramentaria]|uniref:Secreted protein n=1 Tax=Batillaria attramentaria TaxID=370345 RepID=A0ABD0M5P3_9CAEN
MNKVFTAVFPALTLFQISHTIRFMFNRVGRRENYWWNSEIREREISRDAHLPLGPSQAKSFLTCPSTLQQTSQRRSSNSVTEMRVKAAKRRPFPPTLETALPWDDRCRSLARYAVLPFPCPFSSRVLG